MTSNCVSIHPNIHKSLLTQNISEQGVKKEMTQVECLHNKMFGSILTSILGLPKTSFEEIKQLLLTKKDPFCMI